MHALLFLGLVLAADDTKDKANIEGTWVVEKAIKDGKEREETKGDKVTFKDGQLLIKGKDKEEKGTYKLDPTAKPKAIDVFEEGKDKGMKGIYQLVGDKLTICISPDPDGKRPTELSAKEGSGTMLLEFKREKK